MRSCWSRTACIDIRDDDDEAVAEIVDQFVIQNKYTGVVGGDHDDSVEAALGSLNIAAYMYLHHQICDWIGLLQCIQQLHARKTITCPHTNFVTSGLPTQNRIQQSSGVRPPQKSRPRWATYNALSSNAFSSCMCDPEKKTLARTQIL
jgi:hypothetical protein